MSGSFRASQAIFAAGHVGSMPGWPVISYVCCWPNLASSSADSRWARLSSHTIALRSAAPSAPTGSSVSPCAEIPMAAMRARVGLALPQQRVHHGRERAPVGGGRYLDRFRAGGEQLVLGGRAGDFRPVEVVQAALDRGRAQVDAEQQRRVLSPHCVSLLAFTGLAFSGRYRAPSPRAAVTSPTLDRACGRPSGTTTASPARSS